MSTPETKHGKNNYLSPLIDKLLSEPLTFKAARFPDSVSIKPSSYLTFTTTTRSSAKVDNQESTKKKVSADQLVKEMPRPKSVAEAVAQYTGRKFLSKQERKRKGPKPEKKKKKVKIESFSSSDVVGESEDGTEENGTDAEGDDNNEDSESDEDFQTADEDTEDEGAEENPSAIQSDSEDLDQLKKDLKEDMYQDSDEEEVGEEVDGEEEEDNEEDEDEDEDEEEDGELDQDETLKDQPKETPPTSPEEELAKSSTQLKIPADQFYDFDEEENDRGSNGSTRIFKSWREFKGKPSAVGLLNHGVTCYMNSAVQAMCHIPALAHYLLDVHYDRYSDAIKPRSVTKVLADTVCKMYQIDRKNDRKVLYINPKKLIRKLADINCMMSEWQQEDSHEYFMSLMSRLQEDSTPKGVKLNKSIVYDIFGGLLNQTVTCKNCGHISTTQQEFYDLSIGLENKKRRSSNMLTIQQMSQLRKQIDSNGDVGDDAKTQLSELLKQRILLAQEERKVETEQQQQQQQGAEGTTSPKSSPQPEAHPKADVNSHSERSASPTPSPIYSIENSIKYFFSPELIRTDKRDRSGYVCENCKKTTVAVKVSTIERAPETLAVHLKRFRFNGTASMKVKAKVAYPDVLDLSEFTTSMKTPTRYKLVSVILHQGRSVSSGHYIAHCRQPDGTWATYDDEYVNKIKPAEALSDPSAYVLLYSRLTHNSIEVERDGAAGSEDEESEGSEEASKGSRKRTRSETVNNRKRRKRNQH